MRAEAGNLPQELTSFVGRRRELSELTRLLAGSRLVTLVGVGGVGKTRLALRVGAQVRRSYVDGVWLVELDQVQDEDLIAAAVARALGLRERTGLSTVELLSEFLEGRRLLLVLDNCEHLVCAVAKLVEALLRDTSGVRIMATSRQPLTLDVETMFSVAPLTVPDPGRAVGLEPLMGYEAVRLFTERARAVLPDFELNEARQGPVAEICARLDGLPLAIELAVPRLRVLTPEQIRDRLSDRGLLTRGRRTAPARQQTLRGCIEWSHDLCTSAEQRMWARLSVFAGDFDLEAAEGVCADEGLPEAEAVELIASLVDKSILLAQPEQAGVVTYRMLDSIRVYGREQLTGSGQEPEIRRRHRDWHQQLAARFAADWVGPRQREWLRRLDRTLPDLRAALEFSLDEPDGANAALGMSMHLQSYWGVSGLHRQGRYWAGRALAAPGPPAPTRVQALCLDASAAISLLQLPDATARVHQVQEIAGHLDDRHSRAVAAVAEGMLAIARGDFATAVSLHTEAFGVFRAEGDIFWQAVSLIHLTLTKVLLDDMAGAAGAHEAMLAICQPQGDCWFSGFTAMSLGIGLWKQGDLDTAATQMTQSLQLLRRTGDTLTTSWALEVLAWIATGRQEPQRAAKLLGAAAALAETMGTRAAHWPDLLIYHEQCQQQVREALGRHAFEATFKNGYSLPLDQVINDALGQQHDEDRSSPASNLDPLSGPLAGLTRREREVADLLAQGLSNKEIAAHLVISARTAEGHVDNILRKLECASRAQAAAMIVTLSP
jgi:predicted ATPase/DNA-binding CsgD family transcriptional regulator